MYAQHGKFLVQISFFIILAGTLFTLYVSLSVLHKIQSVNYVYNSIPQKQKDFTSLYWEIFVCLEIDNDSNNSMLSVISRRLLDVSSSEQLDNLEWHIRLLSWHKLLLWYFDQKDITTLYMYYMPFEDGYGIEHSAKFYFNKEYTNLSVDEIITLVAIARSPQRYSPFKQQNDELHQLKAKLYAKLINCFGNRFG